MKSYGRLPTEEEADKVERWTLPNPIARENLKSGAKLVEEFNRRGYTTLPAPPEDE